MFEARSRGLLASLLASLPASWASRADGPASWTRWRARARQSWPDLAGPLPRPAVCLARASLASFWAAFGKLWASFWRALGELGGAVWPLGECLFARLERRASAGASWPLAVGRQK